MAIRAEHKMKNLEAKNKCPAPTSAGGSSSRPRLGPPPPPPWAPGVQPPRPMWIVRHPQPPQGQAPRPANAYWNNPGVAAKGPCYNCGGIGHISKNCPSPRRGGAFNAPRPIILYLKHRVRKSSHNKLLSVVVLTTPQLKKFQRMPKYSWVRS